MKHDAHAGLLLDLAGVISSEYDDDGALCIQADSYGGQDGPSIELHSAYGFKSRPLDPQVGPNGVASASCKALVGYEGDRPHGWLAEDPRVISGIAPAAALPALEKGESMQHGAWGNIVQCHEDGSVTVTAGSGAVLTMGGETGATSATVDAETINLPGTSVVLGQGGTPVVLATALSTYLGLVLDALTLAATALASALPISGITSAQSGALTTAVTALSAQASELTTAMQSLSTTAS